MLQKHLLQPLQRIDQPRFVLGWLAFRQQGLSRHRAVLVNVLRDDCDEALNVSDGDRLK